MEPKICSHVQCGVLLSKLLCQAILQVCCRVLPCSRQPYKKWIVAGMAAPYGPEWKENFCALSFSLWICLSLHLARHLTPRRKKSTTRKRAQGKYVMKECQQVSMCHAMPRNDFCPGCGERPQGGFSLSAFSPGIKRESAEWGEKPQRGCNLTRPCRGSDTHDRLHFLSSTFTRISFPSYRFLSSFLLSISLIDFSAEIHVTRVRKY